MLSRTTKYHNMKNIPSAEERIWAVIAHLSAIAMGMGLLLPIIGWSEQRRKSNYASFQCLQALGYQSLGYTIWILFTLLVLVFSSIAAIAGIANAENLQNEMMSVVIAHTALMFGLIGVYFALPVIAAVACAFGKDFRYPLMGQRLARYLGYDLSQTDAEQTWLNEDHENRWITAMGHFSVIIALWGMLAPLTTWILQGKRSLFLKFQSIQTLVYQVGITLLFFGAGMIYMFGFFIFIALTGFGEGNGLSSSTGMVGVVILILSMLVAILIVLVIPLFHIMGQWAGYCVLKGDNYHYPVLGNLVERRMSKFGGEEKHK